MQKGPTDREIQKQYSKFDVDVREEASYILWHIWKDSNPSYATLQACIGVLYEDDDLYSALKAAHIRGEYDEIRNWKGGRSRATLLIGCPNSKFKLTALLSDSPGKDALIEGEIRSLLAELQPTVEKLVVGNIIFPTWTPSLDSQDPEIVDHLTGLKIPFLKGKPNLLLHDLGSFTKDSLLEKRLNNIFMPNNHTFVCPFIESGLASFLCWK